MLIAAVFTMVSNPWLVPAPKNVYYENLEGNSVFTKAVMKLQLLKNRNKEIQMKGSIVQYIVWTMYINITVLFQELVLMNICVYV